MNLGFYFTPYIKINSVCILDIKVRAKIIKLRKPENLGVNLQDSGVDNGF